MQHYEVRAKYVRCKGSGWLVYETTNEQDAIKKFNKYKKEAKEKWPTIRMKLVKITEEVIKR